MIARKAELSTFHTDGCASVGKILTKRSMLCAALDVWRFQRHVPGLGCAQGNLCGLAIAYLADQDQIGACLKAALSPGETIRGDAYLRCEMLDLPLCRMYSIGCSSVTMWCLNFSARCWRSEAKEVDFPALLSRRPE